jgi:hypothetical protein
VCELFHIQQELLEMSGLKLPYSKTMQLRPEVRLEVGFSDAGATSDPCDPIVRNGYLGAENQLIRVQISDAGSGGSLGSGVSSAFMRSAARLLPESVAKLSLIHFR